MIRNFKVLGLALVAALALTAVVASAAPAAVFKTPEGKSAKLEASQVGTNVFSIEGSNWTCEHATFSSAGEEASGTTAITLHPTYTGCSAFGFLNIVITTIGCDYVIHMTSGTSGGTFHGDMDVVCAGAATISVVAGTCEMKIGGQSGLTNIMTTNNTTGTDSVTLEAELSGIAVTKVKDGFLCPLSGTGATTGSYNGDIVAKGFNGGTQVDITFD